MTPYKMVFLVNCALERLSWHNEGLEGGWGKPFLVRPFLGYRSTKTSFWLVLVGLGSPFYSELVSILLAGVIHSIEQKRWGKPFYYYKMVSPDRPWEFQRGLYIYIYYVLYCTFSSWVGAPVKTGNCNDGFTWGSGQRKKRTENNEIRKQKVHSEGESHTVKRQDTSGCTTEENTKGL